MTVLSVAGLLRSRFYPCTGMVAVVMMMPDELAHLRSLDHHHHHHHHHRSTRSLHSHR